MNKRPFLFTNLAGIKMKNPVMVASGTFGYGEEYKELVDLNKLGAIVTKTITLKPKLGNPPPRIVETAAGMLNAVGLQNVGLEVFLKEKLPNLKKITSTPIIVSVGGESVFEYIKITEELNKIRQIAGIELNISCPNIRFQKKNNKLETKKIFSQDAKLTYKLVDKVRKVTRLPLIVKLSPNVTDITRIARACEEAGADVVSLINTP
ncbi:dihydroorotate dehydrogenase, partial [bacterium]|nr:dihydroorotate dehydrogenase [bacterium]